MICSLRLKIGTLTVCVSVISVVAAEAAPRR